MCKQRDFSRFHAKKKIFEIFQLSEKYLISSMTV